MEHITSPTCVTQCIYNVTAGTWRFQLSTTDAPHSIFLRVFPTRKLLGEAVIQREGQVSGDEQGMGLVNQRQQ
jgi:hypothetical protein